MHRGIKQPPHLHHHQPHLVQQPWARSVASFSPYFQGSAAIPPPAPFLLCHSSAPPPTIPHHDSPFGDTDVDPYFLLPPSGLPPARASSCYSASSGLSSTLQDFSPEEVGPCLVLIQPILPGFDGSGLLIPLIILNVISSKSNNIFYLNDGTLK